ncbi:MAG: hypothetical protein DLM56_13575 [Pseudonocardiales bacterium]|nr:MAG: hypothetical protein DLM56_13575 [Pseudonocardiales bacterium]
MPRPAATDRAQDMLVEPVQQPERRWHRGHRPERILLVGQHVDPRDAAAPRRSTARSVNARKGP